LKGEGISEALDSLNEKIQELLKIYDKIKKDGEIDLEELTAKKKILAEDLNKHENSEVQKIAKGIKKLEQKIIEYRKSSYK